MERSSTLLKNFGKLMHRMRGTTSIETLAERIGMAPDYLISVETGSIPIDEWTARQILIRGFGLDRRDSSRLILGVKLYDLGLRDGDIRQLTADVIMKLAPDAVVDELRRLYRSYSD